MKREHMLVAALCLLFAGCGQGGGNSDTLPAGPQAYIQVDNGTFQSVVVSVWVAGRVNEDIATLQPGESRTLLLGAPPRHSAFQVSLRLDPPSGSSLYSEFIPAGEGVIATWDVYEKSPAIEVWNAYASADPSAEPLEVWDNGVKVQFVTGVSGGAFVYDSRIAPGFVPSWIVGAGSLHEVIVTGHTSGKEYRRERVSLMYSEKKLFTVP